MREKEDLQEILEKNLNGFMKILSYPLKNMKQQKGLKKF